MGQAYCVSCGPGRRADGWIHINNPLFEEVSSHCLAGFAMLTRLVVDTTAVAATGLVVSGVALALCTGYVGTGSGAVELASGGGL